MLSDREIFDVINRHARKKNADTRGKKWLRE